MTQDDPAADLINIEISGKLDVAEFITDVPFADSVEDMVITASQISDLQKPIVRDVALQPQVKQEIQDWIAQRREGARNGIAITLLVFFGISLLAEFLLIGLGAFYPQSNTALIKDTLPLLINSLTSIVTVALAFYFKDK
jgi:hypothetical protein